MKKGWLIAGGILGVTMGASLGACSSTTGSGTGNNTTTHASSSGTQSSSSGTNSSSSGTGGVSSSSSSSSGTGGTTSSSSGTGNCGTVGTLHPPKLDAGANVYCPFSAAADAGNIYCKGGTEHCCETPNADAGPSTCDPIATACASGDTDWACEDPVADCPSGQVCCAPGASIGLGTPGCGNFAHTMHNTVCVANFAACTGIVMCTNSTECPSGQTCTAFSKAGNQVGGCM